jgi:hypothetical protein
MAKKDEVLVDFGDTESREGKKSTRRIHLPPGDYAAKCVKAELGKSKEKKTPGILCVYQITQGKHKGKKLRDDLWLTEGSLWRTRQTLEAMGIRVPSKKVKIDVTKMKNKELAITLEDDEYDDKVYSRVADAFLLSELDTDEDEEEEEDEEGEEEDTEDEEDEEESSDEEEDEEDLEDLDLDDL